MSSQNSQPRPYRSISDSPATTMVRRLEAEPGIRGAAMGTLLPGMDHRGQRIVLDGEEMSDDFRGHQVGIAG